MIEGHLVTRDFLLEGIRDELLNKMLYFDFNEDRGRIAT